MSLLWQALLKGFMALALYFIGRQGRSISAEKERADHAEKQAQDWADRSRDKSDLVKRLRNRAKAMQDDKTKL